MEKINTIIDSTTLLLAVIGAFTAIIQFHHNNRIKRADFLEKLIEEFHNSKLDIAKSLLDDFIYVPGEMRESSAEEQLRTAQSLASFLRNHKEEPVTTENEIKVRESFDHLLDFFTKLSYYLKQKLIKPSDFRTSDIIFIKSGIKQKF